MFAIPWRERTVLGTTDTDFDGTADEVAADADDVKYLCDSGNGYFPGANLDARRRDRDVGRPAPADRARRRTSTSREVSREHEVFTRNDGLVIIAGGKLTTYRRMAREAVDKTLELLASSASESRVDHKETTKQRPLPGAVGLETADLEGVAAIGRR